MSSETKEKAVQAAIDKEIEGHETPAEVDLHDDRTREMRTPGFSRMRVDWNGPDATVIAAVIKMADDRVAVKYTDAYQIMNDLYMIVRLPMADQQTGEIITNRHGWPEWERTESGRYVEDYSRLGIKEKDDFLMQITTRLFDWEQMAAENWAEAMFAKAQWEERFSTAFTNPAEGTRRTDEGLTQHARYDSREERYFAIFESLVSRKSDALVKSMERIALRLSQTINS
jgi:hypothetical protein